eukprot:266481_1
MSAFWDILSSGGDLVSKQGAVSPSSLRASGKVVGVYFYTSWSPVLKYLHQNVLDACAQLEKEDKPFEVLYCSGELSGDELDVSLELMPDNWVALPFGDVRKAALLSHFRLRDNTMPKLVTLDADSGRVINAHAEIMAVDDPQCERFPWPSPVFELSAASAVHCLSSCSLIVFHPPDLKNETMEVVETVAREEIDLLEPATTEASPASATNVPSNAAMPLEFFVDDPASECAVDIFNMSGGVITRDTALFILHWPTKRVYVSELDAGSVNATTVREFVRTFRSGGLEAHELVQPEVVPPLAPTATELAQDVFEILADGGDLTSKQGAVSAQSLRGTGKVLALYFSASWCGPCKDFTPKLKDVYERLKAGGKQLEVIYCPMDADDAGFRSYYATMPWLAVPFGDARVKALTARFRIAGIPALVMVDANSGDTICTDGRTRLGTDPEGADFPWYEETAKPLVELVWASAANVAKMPCLVAYPPDDSKDEMLDAVETVAKEDKQLQVTDASHPKMDFFYSGKEPVARVFRQPFEAVIPADAALLIFDYPNARAYACEERVDVESVRSFIRMFRAGELEGYSVKK